MCGFLPNYPSRSRANESAIWSGRSSKPIYVTSRAVWPWAKELERLDADSIEQLQREVDGLRRALETIEALRPALADVTDPGIISQHRLLFTIWWLAQGGDILPTLVRDGSFQDEEAEFAFRAWLEGAKHSGG